jgi:hypothetical protein
METQNKIDVKKIIQEEGHIKKFEGIAPNGFVLVHEKTLEDLKEFEVWRDWKHNEISIQELNKINFDNT